jgi:mannose-6-phosphate isomerase-like protein (cupin superfamily)
MKTQILDFQKLKKFSDEKRHMEIIWADDHSTIKLICLKPGQEISTHTHHGNHTWVVLEGSGEFLSSDKETQVIDVGKIVIVPPLVEHGIRNVSRENLVLASIAAPGD